MAIVARYGYRVIIRARKLDEQAHGDAPSFHNLPDQSHHRSVVGFACGQVRNGRAVAR